MPANSLAHTLSTLPNKPGVYQYYDTQGRVLYVGKAKVLKNRVRSYFSITQTKSQNTPIPNPNLSARIALMVRQIARIELVVVDSESDALILENSFIKQLKPKYNILLRDDKTYPYIAFDMGLDFPVPMITRVVKSAKHMLYFGPYPSGSREIVDSLLELFPLVQRSPTCINKHRACLFYHINRCLAPCIDKIDTQAYRAIVDSAITAIKNPATLHALLEQKMLSLAESLRFEEAQIYRDRLRKLAHLQTLCVLDLAKEVSFDIVYFYAPNAHQDSHQDIYQNTHQDTRKPTHHAVPEAFSMDSSTHTTGVSTSKFAPESTLQTGVDSSSKDTAQKSTTNQSTALLLWLFVRGGKMVSYTHEFVRVGTSYNLSEIYTQALLNRYTNPLPLVPESIVLGDSSCFTENQLKSVQAVLKHAQGRKIPIQSLHKGKNAKFLPIVEENAKLLLSQHTQESDLHTLERLQELFSLERVPEHIEVFDTSHHSGSSCVGGMIVWAQGDFHKERYRRYKLESSDEYGQMREMLTRRALRFCSEPPPDLWLLDGGRAQIAIAKEVLESSGVYVDVLAIAKEKRDAKAYRAKGKASDSIYTQDHIVRLDSSDTRLQFLQKLRDSVHHYAISYHRHDKKNALTQKNALKQKGLTDAQIKRALAFSGSYESLKDKNKDEILALIRSQNTRPKTSRP